MINIRLFLAGILTLFLFTTSSFGRDEQSEPKSPENQAVTVEIKNLQFVPNEIVVPAGTTINWVNLDPVDHDVTSGVSVIGRKTRDLKQTKFPDGKFSSGLFGKDKTYSVNLDEKGEYKYYCNIHPFMVAKIVVK